MQSTMVDIFFSEATRHEDGTKGNEICVAETLVVEWDSTRRKYQASNPDGHPSWVGYGDGRTQAVLDYLRARLGIDHKLSKVSYSNRIY